MWTVVLVTYERHDLKFCYDCSLWWGWGLLKIEWGKLSVCECWVNITRESHKSGFTESKIPEMKKGECESWTKPPYRNLMISTKRLVTTLGVHGPLNTGRSHRKSVTDHVLIFSDRGNWLDSCLRLRTRYEVSKGHVSPTLTLKRTLKWKRTEESYSSGRKR